MWRCTEFRRWNPEFQSLGCRVRNWRVSLRGEWSLDVTGCDLQEMGIQGVACSAQESLCRFRSRPRVDRHRAVQPVQRLRCNALQLVRPAQRVQVAEDESHPVLRERMRVRRVAFGGHWQECHGRKEVGRSANHGSKGVAEEFLDPLQQPDLDVAVV